MRSDVARTLRLSQMRIIESSEKRGNVGFHNPTYHFAAQLTLLSLHNTNLKLKYESPNLMPTNKLYHYKKTHRLRPKSVGHRQAPITTCHHSCSAQPVQGRKIEYRGGHKWCSCNHGRFRRWNERRNRKQKKAYCEHHDVIGAGVGGGMSVHPWHIINS